MPLSTSWPRSYTKQVAAMPKRKLRIPKAEPGHPEAGIQKGSLGVPDVELVPQRPGVEEPDHELLSSRKVVAPQRYTYRNFK